MVLDSYSKYDGFLVGIGITIVLMLTGILVSMSVTLIAGVVGLSIMTFALFVEPPVDGNTMKVKEDRKI